MCFFVKSFRHEHVGVKNEAQHGLLVTEEQVNAAGDDVFFCQVVPS